MKTLFILLRRLIYIILGFPSIFGIVKKPLITVLCYHSISNDGWRFSTTPSEFKKQMDLFSKYYDFISADQLVEYMAGNFKPRRPSILLTFDDGYKNLMDVVALLLEMKIKPVVFIIANPKKVNRNEIDSDLELLSKSDIKKLSEINWTIGSHTNSHPNMKSNKIDIDEEIGTSRNVIKEVTGKTISYIAYPKGIYDEKILRSVKKAGYTLGFSMDDALLMPTINPLTIPRVGIDGSHSVIESLMTSQPLSILFRKFVRHKLKISI